MPASTKIRGANSCGQFSGTGKRVCPGLVCDAGWEGMRQERGTHVVVDVEFEEVEEGVGYHSRRIRIRHS